MGATAVAGVEVEVVGAVVEASLCARVAAGDGSVASCKYECAKSAKCNAVELYPGHGGTECHHVDDASAATGSGHNGYMCYLKTEGTRDFASENHVNRERTPRA